MARYMIQRLLGVLLLGGVMIWTASCSLEPEDDTRETIGIEEDGPRVWSDQPLWGSGEGWSIPRDPQVEVGLGTEEDPPFTEVGGAVLTADGFVVGNQHNPPEVRFYDPLGVLYHTAGREGQGPGEYRQVLKVWPLLNGQILVADPFAQRLTRLGRDGTTENMVAMRSERGQRGIGPLLPFEAFGDGSVIALPNRTILPGTTGSGWTRLPFVRIGADGAIMDTLGTFPVVQYAPTADGRSLSLVFGKVFAMTTAGDRMFHGTGERYEIEERSSDGSLIRTFGRNHEPRPVTREMVEALKADQLLEAGDDANRRAGVEQRFRNAAVADTLPAYRDILVDRNDHVWILDYPAPGDTARSWSVFDSERRYLGSITTPLELRLVDVEDDRALGIWTDPFGVQTVRIYRVLKG